MQKDHVNMLLHCTLSLASKNSKELLGEKSFSSFERTVSFIVLEVNMLTQGMIRSEQQESKIN